MVTGGVGPGMLLYGSCSGFTMFFRIRTVHPLHPFTIPHSNIVPS